MDKHHWKSKDFYPYVNVASGIAKMFVGELIETGMFVIVALILTSNLCLNMTTIASTCNID